MRGRSAEGIIYFLCIDMTDTVLEIFWTGNVQNWKSTAEQDAASRLNVSEKGTCYLDGASTTLEGFCEYRSLPVSFDKPTANVPQTLFVLGDITKLGAKNRVPLPYSDDHTGTPPALSTFIHIQSTPNPDGKVTKAISPEYTATLCNRQVADPVSFIAEYSY